MQFYKNIVQVIIQLLAARTVMRSLLIVCSLLILIAPVVASDVAVSLPGLHNEPNLVSKLNNVPIHKLTLISNTTAHPLLQPPKPEVPVGTHQVSVTAALTKAKPFLFGLGAQIGGVVDQRLYKEAPINLLTSWFSHSSDLGFMRGFQNKEIPAAYASGKSLHIIVWTGDDETNFTTKYGPACGRSYPFSAVFADDMKQLADIYNGNGPLYVSMFTEFQTYPCQDNNWQGSENYYTALKDQYRLAQQIFHEHAPNAKLALSWGGWQASWDDPARGGGKSMFGHFADILNSSDFQSFQAMDSMSNTKSITEMTHQLHAYGNGAVMLAHYKPDNGSQIVWQKDMASVFTPNILTDLKQNGLFAFSFMDEKNINATEESFQEAKAIVTQNGL